MSTNTLTARTLTGAQRLLAVVDESAPAKVTRPRRTITPDDTVFAVPAYFEDGFAVFIGEDAAVLVQEKALPDLSLRLVRGSIAARTGHFPAEQGIVVQPFGSDTSLTYPGKHGQAQYAWALVHHTVTIPA